jgi:hypothetical protein
MSDLSDRIKDTFPANGQEGVPLTVDLTITLSGLNYDEDSLKEGLFLEGPDTDQYVGPGLLELQGNNVSQGDLDDFLQSPGYAGIVAGEVTVSGIAGDTVVTFNPTLPMAPLTTYTMNLTEVLDSSESTIDGFVILSFIAGTGSIEEIPSTISSSVLSATLSESGTGLTADDIFSVLGADPADHSINIPIDTDEIIVKFNKPINPASIAGNVQVKTIPATDHPNAITHSVGDLAITTEIEGNNLKIKI